MLKIDLMTINRVVVHTIPSRGPDRDFIEPTGSGELVRLEKKVADVVVGRLAKALGHHSHGIKADFTDVAADSMFHRACTMMDCDDDGFLKLAGEAAHKLARAQMRNLYEPAKLVSMSGFVTPLERPFVAFIKADLEAALTEQKRGKQVVLEVLNNIFMTESQRLFKIGFVGRTVGGSGMKGGVYQKDHHSVHLFDHLMTGTESRKAAMYFYSDFLGSDVAASDRRLTQDFFEKTMKYFKEEGFDAARRIEAGEALRAELRSNTQTLSVADFAKAHLRVAESPRYVAYMAKVGFPVHAVTKDTEYVKTKLRRRQRITFSSDVQITTPPDKIQELLEIRANPDGTSTVLVKGTVTTSE
jgi:hypothetical protein